MAWEGFFQFGGTEIINAARTEAYSSHLNAGWFKPIYKQPDLAWLLGDKDYATPLQDDAPWTDPDNLDSYDFLGVYPLEVTGIEDSTVSATVTESVIDGGYIGRTRKGTRAVVFNAVLVGLSPCAVEYGLRWLRMVLSGNPCFGSSYGNCGGSDLCYLACLPTIADMEAPLVPGPILLDATNLAMNPGGESGLVDGWHSYDPAKWAVASSTVLPVSGVRSILSTRQPDAPLVVATNLTPNPNLEAGSATGWASNDSSRYSTANSTASPIGGTRSLVTTRQASSPSRTASSILLNSAPGVRIPVTAGQQYTIGLDVKTENPPVVDSTNLVSNPIGSTPAVTTYWPPTRASVAAAADYLRATVTDATVSALGQRINSPQTPGTAGTIPVTPGQAIRTVGQVRSSASNQMAATIIWIDAANAVISSVTGLAKNANPTTWTEVEVSGVVPANTVNALVQFGIWSGARVIGDTFDVQRVYVGTAGAPSPWFDGSTAASGDYSYRWTGAVGLSPSERVRANPPVKTVTATNAATNPNLESGLTGWSTADATRYTASLDTTAPISGTQSAMLTRTATSLDTNAAVFNINGMNPNAWIPISNGVPVTLGFDIKTELANRAIKVSLNQYDAAGAFLSQTPVVTLVAATSAGVVQRVVQTITPNNANAARGYLIITATSNSGNATAGERVWVDNLRIGGDGAYFDGDTPASGGNFYRWTGARLTSTSERYTETANLRKISLNASFDVGGSSTATVIDNVQPGVVTRIVHTLTAPAGSSGMYPVCIVDASISTAIIATGERVWHDNLLIEKGATSGAYWDGSSPTSGDTAYRWTGAVNASTSEKLNTAMRDPVAASLYLTQSATGAFPITPVPVAVAMDMRIEQAGRRVSAQLSWLDESGTSIGTTDPVELNPLAGTVFRLLLKGTPPAGAVAVRPIVLVTNPTGVSVAGEQVWFDNLYVGTDTSGAYFDGDTPDTTKVVHQWTGEANTSTSQRLKQTYVPGPGQDPYECYEKVGRSLHEVTTTVGPNVTKKMDLIDGGAAWSVTWTMVAANPAEFGVERPLVVGFLDPLVDIPYYGGVVPDGGMFDEDGYVQTEQKCQAPVFVPVFDPTCSLLVAPPDVPTIVPTCFSFPVNYTRRSFTIPRDKIPLWTEIVPVLQLTTKQDEARNVRIRFYADTFDTGNPASDPCNYCGDLVVSYIPPSSTLVLDGMDQSVYIDQPGQGRRRADAVVSDSSGNPFEWPQFSCGFGYVVTVDTPQQTKALPVIDLSLVPRII